jgi:hypothetical protein
MKGLLAGIALTLVLLAGAAAWVWHYSPESLPAEWRRDNPHSRDYAPVIYRWKDAEGVVQLTDRPPADRPYETVRIDPDRNVVPGTPATPRGD